MNTASGHDTAPGSAPESELDASQTYVITLCSSSVPMPVHVPFVHDLVCFSVFRSRSVEEGRLRCRLHLGYFDSQERAREALRVVRRHYPAAWISPEPSGSSGSLDDTMNTAFTILKEARARVVAPQDLAPPVFVSAAADEPATTDIHQHGTPQRYVLQLNWSETPMRPRFALRLAAFRDYHLYSVRAIREGIPQHGLRLGFFKNIHSAAQVAVQSRTRYPEVSVVPISHREYTLAADSILRNSAWRRSHTVDVKLAR
jgi:hypothetical protein